MLPALLCGLLDKIATDVKIMQMTELSEVQEPYGGGRGASGTMPQKRIRSHAPTSPHAAALCANTTRRC